ncbi:MAG: hypothetical protein Q4E88_03620 [Coriobacteriia bacterium]|nr:hypothetical protein [Coriobacteriia bacterium]
MTKVNSKKIMFVILMGIITCLASLFICFGQNAYADDIKDDVQVRLRYGGFWQGGILTENGNPIYGHDGQHNGFDYTITVPAGSQYTVTDEGMIITTPDNSKKYEAILVYNHTTPVYLHGQWIRVYKHFQFWQKDGERTNIEYYPGSTGIINDSCSYCSTFSQ